MSDIQDTEDFEPRYQDYIGLNGQVVRKYPVGYGGTVTDLSTISRPQHEAAYVSVNRSDIGPGVFQRVELVVLPDVKGDA